MLRTTTTCRGYFKIPESSEYPSNTFRISGRCLACAEVTSSALLASTRKPPAPFSRSSSLGLTKRKPAPGGGNSLLANSRQNGAEILGPNLCLSDLRSVDHSGYIERTEEAAPRF